LVGNSRYIVKREPEKIAQLITDAINGFAKFKNEPLDHLLFSREKRSKLMLEALSEWK
jgi:hypothetical protein